MSEYSPYADAESSPPDWNPGEEQTSTVFLALTLYMVIELNIAIWRVFKKKQGLYYWALISGTWGLAIGTIGNILKNLTPQYGPKIWPLWSLMILGGWSVFATAECVLLYSRLHLVNRSFKIQRWILILVVVGSFVLVAPNWVILFPAYDLDPKISSIWSPRQAILDRTNQLGFTVIEAIIGGIYIWSLATLLRVKATIRQRRVMRDLFCIMIVVILLDIIVAILIFVNQVNLSFSIQDFSYALKYKFEFVVLNQLMAVAGCHKKGSFAERRYRQQTETATPGQSSSNETSGIPMQQFSQSTQTSRGHKRPPGISAPAPSYSKPVKTPRDAYERRDTDEQPLKLDELPHEEESFETEKDSDFDMEKGNGKDGTSYDIHLQPSAKSKKHRSLRHPFGQGQKGHEQHDKNGGLPTAATATKHNPNSSDDDDDEEIGLHMYVHPVTLNSRSLQGSSRTS